MASNTALNFILYASALLLLDYETRKHVRPAQHLAVAVFIIALFSVLNYSYGATTAHSLAGSEGMTLYPAFGFIALALGILCARPRQGLMVVILSRTAGGGLARRLLLAAVLVPLVLGWLIIMGEKAQYYEPAFAIALLVAASIFVFLVVIWRNAESLHYMALRRDQAEEALRHAYDDMEHRVRARTAELGAANAELQREVYERKRIEEERAQLLVREQALREEAEQSAETLRRLQAVTDSALAHLSLDDLLQEMLGRVRRLLKVDAAAILLFTEDKESLVVRATVGLRERIKTETRIPIGQTIIAPVVSARKAVMIDHPPTIELVSSLLQEKIQTLIAAPLMVEDRLIGFIQAASIEERSFTQGDMRLLQLVADRVALAVEQSRLYEVEQRARLQAEATNRMKDEFLATVSHELRSPLHVILGWVQMLRNGSLDKSASARAVTTIERSARAQDRIISDLLDVSRIITGKLRLDMHAIDLIPVIEAGVGSLRPAAEAKGVRLQVVFDPNVGPISGDAERLQQIVWNLVSNAIKFTPERGRVQVRLEHANSQAKIIVRDTGDGISQSFLPYVFDRFRQEDSSSTRKQGGLGLGLAIVRHLVELHGGTVEVESEGINRGATLTIKLPLLVNPQLAAETMYERFVPEEHVPAVPLTRLDGLRILVVDDAEETRELVATILAQQKAEVRTATSAHEALQVLPKWRPDILVSDIEMPETDGYSLIRQIRAREKNSDGQLPAVALTAYTRAEDRLRALSAGFQMHVPKPIEAAELITVVASLGGRLH